MRWSNINVMPMSSRQAENTTRSRGYMQPHCAWMSTRTFAIEHGHHWEGAGKNEEPRGHEDLGWHTQCATGTNRLDHHAAATVHNSVGHLSVAELVAAILALESVGLEV